MNKITTDAELEWFKTEINLSEFAATEGYKLIQDRCSSRLIFMKKGAKELVIGRGHDNHWIFSELNNTRKNSGSIIDFCQWEFKGLNLGEIRQKLRPWKGFVRRPKISPEKFVRNVKSRERDLILIAAKAEGTLEQIDKTSKVLDFVEFRSIPRNFILQSRFCNKIKSDTPYNNLIFPHYHGKDIVGWEIKNFEFTGFPGGSTKGVFFTERLETDKFLILAESGIDLLSYYVLNPERVKDSWGFSTAGGWGPYTIEMIRQAFKKYPHLKIIRAFDNDDAGKKYSKAAYDLAIECGIDKQNILEDLPKAKDWNLDLKNRK